ncbi:GNAT family N-acetyltransferase [Candidatus Gottesmanbacteria bacterium]|nr:GNAT family N-acetyltransferase [Candidatus Gottesmanbacteria bacterium]
MGQKELEISAEQTGVTLRQFVLADAEPLFTLINNNREHLNQHGDDTAQKYPDLESAARSISNPPNPRKLRFGIWDGQTFVGSVNLTPQEEQKEAELGYWLGSQFTGKGYATIATKTLANYAVNELGYKRIFAKVNKNNQPSIKTLERSGFIRTGETESDYIYFFTSEKIASLPPR